LLNKELILQIKQDLINHIKLRLQEEGPRLRAVQFLNEIPVEDYIDEVVSVIYTHTRREKKKELATFAEIICGIGFAVRNRFSYIRDTAASAKTGAFLLYTFEQLGLVKTFKTRGKNYHATLVVEIVGEKLMRELYISIPKKSNYEKLPATTPYVPWEKTVHPTGSYLVKTTNRSINKILNAEDYPVVFEAINKSQAIGWRVNHRILDVQKWALANKELAFDDIWNATSKEAEKTKFRESRTILDLAEKIRYDTFYHLFYLDFRGRAYPSTAYLHHQGSDVARGLLLRDDTKELGKHGYKWLCISAANTWASTAEREDQLKTDKIPLVERADWALANLETLKRIAQDPYRNKTWMSADKPWQFLAVCFEILNVEKWIEAGNAVELYESRLEVYIDGTCNGHQHLAALTRDKEIAKYVNLMSSEMPGDLYAYIAVNVWARIDARYSNLSKDRILACNEFIAELKILKNILVAAKRGERKEIAKEIIALREDKKTLMDDACVVFWHKIDNIKERRKILKRNVMTIPYGASGYGLGEQIIEDSKRYGIKWLFNIEYKFASYLGRLTYETCEYSLRKSIKLLRAFEDCGRFAEELGDFLSWQVPLTGFPVVQHYVEGRVKKTWIQYGPKVGEKLSTNQYPNTYQVMLSYLEDPVASKRKQAQGAAPNIIHSLDAAHLAFTIASADFPITTIHDSFGCLAGDMEELYSHVRETFVYLYKQEPLEVIAEAIELDVSTIEIGDYNVEEILKAEYAFS